MQLRVTTVEYSHILSNFGKASNLLKPNNKKKKHVVIESKNEVQEAEEMVGKLLHSVDYIIYVYDTLERVSKT